MIQGVIFDLDGTLVDTEAAAARAINEYFAKWKIVLEPGDASFLTGRTWKVAVDHLFSKYAPPTSRQEAEDSMVRAYRDALIVDLQFVQGAAECVRALSEHYPLGLVSGSHRSEIFFALDRLGVRDRFQVVLGAEDYAESKPSPEGYLKAMAQMGLTGETTLIFEDSEAGIQAASQAGAWIVAITSTNHFAQAQALAQAKVADLRGINREWVDQFFKSQAKPKSL